MWNNVACLALKLQFLFGPSLYLLLLSQIMLTFTWVGVFTMHSMSYRFLTVRICDIQLGGFGFKSWGGWWVYEIGEKYFLCVTQNPMSFHIHVYLKKRRRRYWFLARCLGGFCQLNCKNSFMENYLPLRSILITNNYYLLYIFWRLSRFVLIILFVKFAG